VLRRPHPRHAPLLLALALAGILAGCGGGSGGGGEEASFDAGPVEVAAAGSTRPVGERAFVEYSGLGAKATETDVKTTLGVTVQKVDEGDSSDIEGLGENQVPHYVYVEYENHGDGEILIGAAGAHFTIRGSDGEDYDTEGVISIGGEFEPCPDAEADATLAPKQAATDCIVVTLADGVSPKEIRFRGDFVATEEPIGWTVG
jgi:hypothetical protein